MAEAKSRKRALSATENKSPKGKKSKASEDGGETTDAKELSAIKEPDASKTTADGSLDLLRYPLTALPDPAIFYLWADAASSFISGDGLGDSPIFRLKSQIIEAYEKKKQQQDENEDEEADESDWLDGVVSYEAEGEEGEVDEDDEEGEEVEASGTCRKLLAKEYKRKSKEADKLAEEMKEKKGIDQYGWLWEITVTRSEPEGDVPKMKMTMTRPYGLTAEDEVPNMTLWVKDVEVADVNGHQMMDEMTDELASQEY
ncbi:hypothetical protein NEOLEDRAFT_1143049 [Neolentinus lepideus HHB14362 ss-1]|uniref:Uncharacterized protein n=1 Tax=Neolentinus lepideus HHB14362 ss-1 TaxID=1314782 RepID=A0A165MRU9_9AGAM|nr:hypothetical protein NEOLEDRAFT_1143049 [Neolentinus lepideus HHB14362 ss-1]